MDKIVTTLETRNYRAKFDLRLKDQFLNQPSIAKLDQEIFVLLGYRIVSVERVPEEGFTQSIYRKPDDVDLPADTSFNLGLSLVFSNSYRQKSQAVFITSDNVKERSLKVFLDKWFTNRWKQPLSQLNVDLETQSGCPMQSTKISLSKRRQHGAYCSPCPQFKDTPIEKAIEGVLKKNNLAVEKQLEYFMQDAKFTQPDFVLKKHKIVIYCDGIEFHKDTQRIIKDKTQDRKLQIAGYIVLRFSGSEIYRNLASCEKDILDAIKSRGSLAAA